MHLNPHAVVGLHSRLTREQVLAARGDSSVRLMAAARDGGRRTIRVDGVIADYDGYARARTLARELDKLDGAPALLRINSKGGSVFEGFAMYNLARQHPDLHTQVDGVAASAAALIFLAGTERLIPRRAAEVMVHEAWTWMFGAGSKTTLGAMVSKAVRALTEIDARQAEVIAHATGMDGADAQAAIEAETWYGPADALDKGFATAYVPSKKRRPKKAADGDGAAAASGAVDLSAEFGTGLGDDDFLAALAEEVSP